jgi:outer membrane protein assembly factor BamB
MRRLGWIVLTAACLSATTKTWSDDWPQWRGPQRNGVSRETGWAFQWPDDGPKVAWKSKVGLGYSGFVVGDGRVFTVGHNDGKDTVFCFNADTGKEVWKHSYDSELGDKYFQGGTTGTPTIDGDKLYWLSRWGDLFCFEAATGKIAWQKNVQKESGIRVPDWGFTGAPYVHKNLLVLNIGDAGMGVDKTNGNIVWKSANKNAGYSTPLPLPDSAEPLVVFGNADHYVAVNPESGKEAWRVRWVTQYGVNAADPIIHDGKMFISTGYGKGAALFDLKQNPPAEIWKSKVLRTQLSPAVFHEGHIYGVDGDTTDKARLKCIEFATGAEKWSEPNIGNGGLTLADGKLIVLTGQGELMVLPAAPEAFQPTARAQVLGGTSWTAPVLANGRIYCRNSRGDIVCVDVRKNSVAAK